MVPSVSRTCIRTFPRGNTARAMRAVSSGTGGIGVGFRDIGCLLLAPYERTISCHYANSLCLSRAATSPPVSIAVETPCSHQAGRCARVDALMVSGSSKGVLAWHGPTSSRSFLVSWCNPPRMKVWSEPLGPDHEGKSTEPFLCAQVDTEQR